MSDRPSGAAENTGVTTEETHPDHHRVLPLKLGDVSVSPDHLGAVEGPKTTHHFDGALRRVGHLPRSADGNSPVKKDN